MNYHSGGETERPLGERQLIAISLFLLSQNAAVQFCNSFTFFRQLMEEADHPSSSSSVPVAEPSASQVQEEEVRNEQIENGNNSHHQRNHPSYSYSSALPYRVNISISNMAPTEMTDDVWSCLVVLVTFWFFASMTLILGFYGSVNLELGPNCSYLIKTNPLFVQSIKVEEVDEPKHGPMLYGFHKPPPMDVETTWTETHKALILPHLQEWAYFLNKGSKVAIFYTIKSPSSSPLSLVIAQGRDSLVEWIDEPSYPNSTLSWNIIFGSGKIEQEISESSNYYIAVGNLNSEDVEVELKFRMNAFIYNTTNAFYMCSLGHRLCSLKLFLLGTNVAVLTSPVPQEGDDWYVKVSYGPRWMTYFIGSGFMTLLILFTLRYCKMFQASSGDGIQEGDNLRSERAPLLLPKDDDVSSWGSSYGSTSQEEHEDLDELLAMNSGAGKQLSEGENLNRLCVICFDAPRDCFFLPCGHCAACFTCGTRIAEEPGTCPICRRSMKKVRKIFTV
ncbi:ubiquitin-protein ligase, putative [Ricinus communis]|uniref:Ubiquitin-protein ligase, putative n=1 Tax=Ricinus communis TaxID=3988 RepID=B9SI29_RICCO|nr:ubiquitin-protein ligase, putative [Ricinus communis]